MALLKKCIFLLCFLGMAFHIFGSVPVPFSGKLAINGENFHGHALFSFSIIDQYGKVHWSHAEDTDATIENFVRNGRYLVLLGGQGMKTLPADLFLKHETLFLRVSVDLKDGQGMRLLEPDQRITSSPYALSAEIARLAERAQVAGGVDAGAITADMLDQGLLADLNRTSELGEITREMLPQDVRDDLNRTIGIANLSSEVTDKLNQTFLIDAGSITLDQLSQQVRDDINRTITRDRLSSDVLSDINRTITKSMLSQEVLDELNVTIGPSKLSSAVSNALKPVVVGQPSSVVEVGGNSAYLAVDATGGDNTYQWKKDGVDIVGASNKILSIADLNASLHEGNYTVVVSNAFGSVTSSVAQIDVNGSLTEGLVGWWKFDETEGNIASDSSGNGNDGNLTNGPTWTEGKIVGALSFDGVDDFVNFGVRDVFNLESEISVSLWIKASDYKYAQVISKSTLSGVFTWAFKWRVSTERFYFRIYDPSGQYETFLRYNQNPPLNEWSNILFSYGDSNSKLYLNSNLEAEGDFPATLTNQTNPLLLGGAGSEMFFGLIDDVRIYDRALSAFEVKTLYELGEQPVQESGSGTTTVVNGTVADGSITANQLSEQILKYLKPEITQQPTAGTIFADTNHTISVSAEGKYLTYQWKKDDVDLTGETNATLNITDANATLHDGNYSVVVSNDFGSVESGLTEVLVKDGILNGLVGWWKFDEGSGTVAYDSSGNGNDGNLINGPTWTTGKIGGALSFDGVNDYIATQVTTGSDFSVFTWVKTSDGNAHVMGLNDSASWLFWIDNGKLRFELHNGSWNEPTPFTVSSDWTYLSGVFNSIDSSAKIFKNGSFVSTKIVLNRVVDDSTISIGKWLNNSAPRPFNGLIDDVRIYDRALSAEEVQALYQLGQ